MTNFDDAEVRPELHTTAFYNLENLFDIYENKHTNDNDFLPISKKKWTPKRYENKLRKLSYAISKIGRVETGKPPALIGLAEVENTVTVKDLINYNHLKNYNYDFVHFDSPDERGIDVALVYNQDIFEVTHSETFNIALFDDDGTPDYTRDILLVSGKLDKVPVHVLVNHWSSRREGQRETEAKRMAASNRAGEIIEKLRQKTPEAKIIIMGDFNDDPSSNSIKSLVNEYNLYNPMETLRSFSRGTTYHKRQWNLFDQILVSTNFFENTPDSLEFETANIFDADFLKQFSGKFKGTPFRTYVGKKYHGGYSDHFPVYAIFKKN
ncbi:endonuclease/exonuclease/phosphatase family protein [Aestuariibaculum sediminum]|uniref:Endonuclease n=1 Tax=Aestuariibaculum sediminum TaxID=2770637 RepID=A0A8J6PYF4_9FLAO|nr:endonuclease/exonuclease/phosphatase family protein [Aestuariibaculum sediminum]MBD0831037.1 endonuclease [Aestuariibaculum sediminum]